MSNSCASDVALRLRCLYTHCVRGWAEAKRRKEPQSVGVWENLTARELFDLAKQSLGDSALRTVFTARERAVVSTPLGKLPRYRMAEATYRAEAIEVLGWALGGVTFRHVWNAPATLVYKLLRPEKILKGDLPPFLAVPRLRPRRELLDRRDFELAWTWRVRMAVLPLTIAIASSHDETSTVSGVDELLAKQVAARATKAAKRGWLTPVGHDFPVGRRSYARAFDSWAGPVMGEENFANERLRAANWVLGPSQGWHRTSTATPLGFVMPKRMIGSKRFLEAYLAPKDDSRWYY